MKVFAWTRGDVVVLAARMEGSGVVGDFFHEVRPGESYAGFDYAGLFERAREGGEIDLPDPPEEEPES